MRDSGFFRLFADCIPVAGAKRGTLCDLSRNRIKIIPLLLCDVLEKLKSNSINQVKLSYNSSNDEGIDKYLDVLEMEEWGFFSDDAIDVFPDIQLNWDSPSEITNAIVDRKDLNFKEVEKIISELDDLQCHAVQIRFFVDISMEYLLKVLEIIEDTSLLCVELVLRCSGGISFESISELLRNNLRLRYVILYNSPTCATSESDGYSGLIEAIKEPTIEMLGCGKIDKKYFAINLQHFSEAQEFNTCLNRKIAIDVDGNIKNCPYFKSSFGKINNASLKEVIRVEEFNKYWTIKKDDISVCKDCEFRYVCTDCRVFKESNSLLSKPEKCRYDPYTCEWR